MLNLFDDRGRAVWIASNRSDFDASCKEMKENGEKFRIFRKRIRTMNGVVRVWVMVLNPDKVRA